MAATVRINAPHMKTESLPSTIFCPVDEAALSSRACGTLCWHIGGRCAGALFALGYVHVPGPRWQLLHWGETSAITVARGSRADTPVVLRTHRLPSSLPHTLSQD